MECGKERATVYRLVITPRQRDVVFSALPFTHYQQAVSHVAAAVRRHAREGDLLSVELQGGTLGNDIAAPRRPIASDGLISACAST